MMYNLKLSYILLQHKAKNAVCKITLKKEVIRKRYQKVITLDEQIHMNLLFMNLQYTVNNGYITAFYLEHHYFPSTNRLMVIVGQKEEITTVECWLHAPTKNINIWLFTNTKMHMN